jgi:glyoxylase-like metal-dependent hydrolase (beta-lactamase superfamily II)
MSGLPPMIHPYRTAERALCVNSFLVEGEDAVVAIDAPMFVPDARAYRARLDALGKPLAGVLITHPHPDHYNGVTELVGDDNVPIIALADVDREIRARDPDKRAQWMPVFGDAWPKTSTFPNQIIPAEQPVELAGLRFVPLDFGPGESVSETVWLLDGYRPPIAFIGDLVFEGSHPYLGDGRTAAWISALTRAQELLDPAAILYVGHGGTTGHPTTVLQEQKRYLLMLREVVRRLAEGAGTLSTEAKAQLVAAMTAYTGGARMTYLLEWGSDALAAELADPMST